MQSFMGSSCGESPMKLDFLGSLNYLCEFLYIEFI